MTAAPGPSPSATPPPIAGWFVQLFLRSAALPPAQAQAFQRAVDSGTDVRRSAIASAPGVLFGLGVLAPHELAHWVSGLPMKAYLISWPLIVALVSTAR